jgi:hypothetical protein
MSPYLPEPQNIRSRSENEVNMIGREIVRPHFGSGLVLLLSHQISINVPVAALEVRVKDLHTPRAYRCSYQRSGLQVDGCLLATPGPAACPEDGTEECSTLKSEMAQSWEEAPQST